jgi:hypothetical protein
MIHCFAAATLLLVQQDLPRIDDDWAIEAPHAAEAGDPPEEKADPSKPKKKQEQERDVPRIDGAGQDWDLELMPERSLYLSYMADPRQCKTGSKVQFPIRGEKEDNIKIENTLGGYRAIALWRNPANPEEEMELFIEAAVFSRFDVQEGWDMDAADYKFGFPFLYRIKDVVLKFSVWHLTSHLGDEFISREGRKRDSYHLDEFSAGFSWQTTPRYRIYGELGIGVYTGPATGSGRAQLGGEWIGGPVSGRVAPFVAFDLQTRNEIGWSWDATVMVGLMSIPKTGGHGFRGTLEYYRGHDQQTQFKHQIDHFWAIGIAADF